MARDGKKERDGVPARASAAMMLLLTDGLGGITRGAKTLLGSGCSAITV